MKKLTLITVKALSVLALTWISQIPAEAGVFNIPHFIPQGESSLGFEPELTLTNGAGVGFNLKYTYGLTDLNNFTAIIGTGGGPRRFRFGGNVTFDFFPDIQGQPGIGIAASAIYNRVGIGTLPGSTGLLEITAIPYIHKAFRTSDGTDFEPFFAIPFGMGFASGNYNALAQLVLGSYLKSSEHVRFVGELGINVNNAETYFSGGVIYYF